MKATIAWIVDKNSILGIDNQRDIAYNFYITFVGMEVYMNQLPQISEAEYQVMKVIWEKAPVSTNEVADYLTQITSWSPKTIHTLLKRLIQKGVLSYTKNSRVFIYTPLVEEADYLKQENSHFLHKFYNGKVSDMLSAFINSNQLSSTDIEEVRKLLRNTHKEEH